VGDVFRPLWRLGSTITFRVVIARRERLLFAPVVRPLQSETPPSLLFFRFLMFGPWPTELSVLPGRVVCFLCFGGPPVAVSRFPLAQFFFCSWNFPPYRAILRVESSAYRRVVSAALYPSKCWEPCSRSRDFCRVDASFLHFRGLPAFPLCVPLHSEAGELRVVPFFFLCFRVLDISS